MDYYKCTICYVMRKIVKTIICLLNVGIYIFWVIKIYILRIISLINDFTKYKIELI